VTTSEVKKIDVQTRREYARCAVAVLRTLKLAHTKMSCKNLGLTVGLIADGEKWEPWHQQQTRDIVNIAAAVERHAGTTDTEPLEFGRIINLRSGEPGAGATHETHLVIEPQPKA
jgi:hypothetical protein